MARVKAEEIVDHLSGEFTRALAAVFRRHAPDADINQKALFRDFRREVGRACGTWEHVPDRYVEKD